VQIELCWAELLSGAKRVLGLRNIAARNRGAGGTVLYLLTLALHRDFLPVAEAVQLQNVVRKTHQ
jgi:hypothetical protein